jgi:DNA-binding CsgD family transcriptional regulator
MKIILEGLTSQAIADRLNISKRTVDKHRRELLAKSGTTTQAGLVKFAMGMKDGKGS